MVRIHVRVIHNPSKGNRKYYVCGKKARSQLVERERNDSVLKVVYGVGWGQKGQKRLQMTIEGPHLYQLEGANNIKNVRNQKSLVYFFQ